MGTVFSADVVCVGAGALGLMIAHDLVREGLQVILMDKGPLGREASWAGAGIIPPAVSDSARTPYEKLRATSYERFPAIAEEVLATSGIDIGFRVTGGIEIAETDADACWDDWRAQRRAIGVATEPLGVEQLYEREPNLFAERGEWIAGMAQVRNPRFLAGLAESLRRQGAVLLEQKEVVGGKRQGDRLTELVTAEGETVSAKEFVLAAGAWSGKLCERLGEQELPIHPVQGEIMVYRTDPEDVRHIILEGKRYIVPRGDGLVLIGATEEDVGFDKKLTDRGLDSLRQFAERVFPILRQRPVVYSWAGLRPSCGLGHPVIGPAPATTNLWLATGHFRHGLQQSPGTARLIADWIMGRSSFAEASDFAVDAAADGFHAPFRS